MYHTFVNHLSFVHIMFLFPCRYTLYFVKSASDMPNAPIHFDSMKPKKRELVIGVINHSKITLLHLLQGLRKRFFLHTKIIEMKRYRSHKKLQNHDAMQE